MSEEITVRIYLDAEEEDSHDVVFPDREMYEAFAEDMAEGNGCDSLEHFLHSEYRGCESCPLNIDGNLSTCIGDIDTYRVISYGRDRQQQRVQQQRVQQQRKPLTQEELLMASKPYKEYTLSDMRRLGMSFMSKHEKAAELASILNDVWLKVVVDIPELCNTSYLEVACEDMDHTKPILDANQVRKNCLAWLRKCAAATTSGKINPDALSLLEDDSFKTVDPLMEFNKQKEDIESSIGTLEGKVRSNTESIHRSEAAIVENIRANREYSEKMAELYNEIDNLKPNPTGTVSLIYTKLSQAINAISDSWEFVSLYKSDSTYTAMFISTSNKICTWIDPIINVNQSLDVGKVAVYVVIRDNKIQYIHATAYPFKTYFSTTDCKSPNNNPSKAEFHPHSGSENTPCFGDQRTIATEAVLNMDIAQWLRAYDKVLTVYNDGSPYIDLNSLKRYSTAKYSLSGGLNSFGYAIGTILNSLDSAGVKGFNEHKVRGSYLQQALAIAICKPLEYSFTLPLITPELLRYIQVNVHKFESEGLVDVDADNIRALYNGMLGIGGVKQKHIDGLIESYNRWPSSSWDKLVDICRFVEYNQQILEHRDGKTKEQIDKEREEAIRANI